MTKGSPKYNTIISGAVQGIVIGDHSTVTMIFQSGEQLAIPFLAPPLPDYELVGRDNLLHDLKQRLFAGRNLALSALVGLPGVGKTALAVALAHDREVLAHFRDGILWAGLGREPDVLALLGSWAATLGISSDEIAKLTTISERSEAIRAKIGRRHMLLVVDDAWQSEAALAFKVGGPNCAHLVTTRQFPIALDFAGEGSTSVTELSLSDGLALLKQFAPTVVEAEPEAAQELVMTVGGLPLALILMGRYLRIETFSRRPHRLRWALEQLREAEERLLLEQTTVPDFYPSLPVGTPLSLLVAIEISDQVLDESARHLLYTLSVFPPKPNTFSEEAVLAVSCEPVEALDTLVDYGLLESSSLGRYTLHQAIADYARVNLTDEATYERMVDFFVNYVETHERDYDILELETNNILAALDIAFEQRMQAALVRGANAFYHFLEIRGLYAIAEVHLGRVQQASKSLVDLVGLTSTLLNLGRIAERRGDYVQAEVSYKEGLTLARQLGNRRNLTLLLQGLGSVATRGGEYTQAEVCWLESLTVAREVGDDEISSSLLQNLGVLASLRGEHEQAKIYWQEGLAIAHHLRQREKSSSLLLNLGVLANNLADYAQAEAYLQEALVLAREIGHSERISHVMQNLGAMASDRGDYAQAEAYFEEALALARAVGHPERISGLLQNLGAVASAGGEYAQAEAYFQEGLALAHKIGHLERISSLLANLGALASDRGEYRQAENYLQESLALARKIGHHWLVGNLLGKLGMTYAALGDLHRALECHEESLAIHHQIGDRLSQVTSLDNLGQTCAALGEVSKAIECYEQALAITRQIGTLLGQSEQLKNLGVAYITLGEPSKATEYYQQALAIVLEIDDQGEYATLSFELALLYVEQSRWYDGLRLLEEVLAIHRQGDDLKTRADTIYQMARTHHLLSNLDKARLHYRDALRLYEHIENQLGTAACRTALGRLMIQLGFLKDALDELQQAKRIYGALGQEQRINEIEQVVQLAQRIKRKQQV